MPQKQNGPIKIKIQKQLETKDQYLEKFRKMQEKLEKVGRIQKKKEGAASMVFHNPSPQNFWSHLVSKN